MQGIPTNWRQMVAEYYPENAMKIKIDKIIQDGWQNLRQHLILRKVVEFKGSVVN